MKDEKRELMGSVAIIKNELENINLYTRKLDRYLPSQPVGLELALPETVNLYARKIRMSTGSVDHEMNFISELLAKDFDET